MIKRKHVDPRIAVMALVCIAVSMFAVIGLYLAVKWGQGDISCSFGKFSGITGQLYVDHDSIDALPKLMDSTAKFAHDLRDELLASKESRDATIERLNGRRGPMGQPFMMIATVTTDDQEKGDMLNDGWNDDHRSCSKSLPATPNPFCTVKMLPKKGRNLLNYRAPDGTYQVREWLQIAMRRGSAWSGAWWRNPIGVVVPKVYHILNVPGADLLIVSWFWAGETFDDVYVGFTEQEMRKLESGRRQSETEIKDGEFQGAGNSGGNVWGRGRDEGRTGIAQPGIPKWQHASDVRAT
jgi:hypothetical protein